MSRIVYAVGFENAMLKNGPLGQEEWVIRLVLSREGTKDVWDKARAWFIEEDMDLGEVECSAERDQTEHENEVEDGNNELDTIGEYDWTSTSTLE